MGCCQSKEETEYLGDTPNYSLKVQVLTSIDNNYGLFDNNLNNTNEYMSSTCQINSSCFLSYDKEFKIETTPVSLGRPDIDNALSCIVFK